MSFKGPLTEATTIQLLPGVDIETPDAQGNHILNDTLKTLSQQAGFQQVYYGCRSEDSNFLQMCIDWDSFQSHQDFVNQPYYCAFVENIKPILASLDIKHFQSTTFPSRLLSSAPVIEFATFFGITPKFLSQLDTFKKDSKLEEALGFTGALQGPVMEEIENEEDESGKTKSYVIAVGWESKEKHVEFTQTKDFRDSIDALLAEATKGGEMYHVAFKTFK